MSTVSTFTYGGLFPTVVFGDDFDAAAEATEVTAPLLLLLLFESLLCLFLMLEQNDFKLKSNDLKLMILELRFIDFFAFGCDDDADVDGGGGGGGVDVVVGCVPIVVSLTISPLVVMADDVAVHSRVSPVLQIKSKRRLLLFNLAELSMRCLAAIEEIVFGVIESVLISVDNGKFNCGRFISGLEVIDVVVLVVGAVVVVVVVVIIVGLAIREEVFVLLLVIVIKLPLAAVTSGLLPLDFKNLLVIAKVSFCHCISQKATLFVSLVSSHMLISSSFGDSAPQMTPEPDATGGQADCHRSASVDIAGGRTGLLSRIRSISSITLVDNRGNN